MVETLETAGAVCWLLGAPVLAGMAFFRRFPSTRPAAHAWSIFLQALALITTIRLLAVIGRLDSFSFLLVWSAWIALLGFAASRHWRGVFRDLWAWRSPLLVASLTVLLGVACFWREQFLQCFNGDGVETYELARSLREHVLPYWEIEATGRLGTVVVNPFLVNSYVVSAMQLLLGETEIATRASYWAFCWGIVVLSCRLVGSGLPPTRSASLTLGLTAFLSCIWYTFYTGYNPYLADLANPGVSDAAFAFLLLLAFDLLRSGCFSAWSATMVLASLILYAGPVLGLLTSLCWWWCVPSQRRPFARAVAGLALALLVITGFYLCWGWLEGSLAGWWGSVRQEYVDDYFRPARRWYDGLRFVGIFVVGCGGVAAWGLLRALRLPGWPRAIAMTALLYLTIILGSGYKNLHYLGPLLPLAPVLLLALRAPESLRRWSGATLVSALCCVWLCWPASRPVFTLNREFGQLTTFDARDYGQACQWAALAEPLYGRGLLSWWLGRHTWVAYAQIERDPRDPRPFLVSDRRPPSLDYQVVLAIQGGPVLYVREARWLQWLSSRQPIAGRDRTPWVLDSFANEPRPRWLYAPLPR